MRKLYLKTLGICLSLFALNVNAQTTYYVKSDGVAGALATSWATASNDLQEVINTAVTGDKIFVAKGSYLPNRPANNLTTVDPLNRDNAFVLKNGVSIYGGFAGGETEESQRVAGNVTILSGDLAGNDVEETIANATNYMTLNKGDNAYHVVLAIGITNATTFDGFTVTKGDASANTALTLTVKSKTIDKRVGGGIYILESNGNLKISNVITTINRSNGDGDALGGGGSGFYINSSSPIIDNCEINKSFNMNALPKVNGYNYGVGMSLVVSSAAKISNTIFSENFGGYGAAVGAHTSNAEFTNCTFKLNRANGRGGAVDIRMGSPIFTNCLFSENYSGSAGGGAAYNYNGRPSFLNCIFYKNRTDVTGAAYGSNNLSYGAIFINNTFFDNKNTRSANATNTSVGIHVSTVNAGNLYSNKKTYFYNNIFYNNTFTATTTGTITPDLYIADIPNSLGVIANNIIQQTDYVSAGQNNLVNTNPQFISTTLGHIGFLAPSNSSPAKDAGSDLRNTNEMPLIAGAIDFNGRGRRNGTIDIGAVEYYTVLPVSFVNFTAKAITAGAQLNWTVASETNNRQYIISRSTDGKNYNLVTNVAGIGTSSTTQSYSYTDQSVTEGTYYYNLEQEDSDGTVNYLATQVVKIGLSATTVNVYPNPAKGKVTVALASGNYQKFSVVGLQGNTLINGRINNKDSELNLDLSNLSTGTYIIKLTGATGNTLARVVKL